MSDNRIKVIHFERFWKKMNSPIFTTIRLFYEQSDKYNIREYYAVLISDKDAIDIYHAKDICLGNVMLLSRQVYNLLDLPIEFIRYDTDSECKTKEDFYEWLRVRYEYTAYKPEYKIEETNPNWKSWNTKVVVLVLFWIKRLKTVKSGNIQCDLMQYSKVSEGF